MALFDFKTAKKTQEMEDKEAIINAEIQAISERGKACLGAKEFTVYAERYVALEQKIINMLIDYTNEWQKRDDSLEKYGIRTMTLLTRLGTLRSLIDQINLDANRGDKKE